MDRFSRGITFGAFEYVHIGHINLIHQARQYCDELIVVVSSDQYIEQKKGHLPAFTLDERIKALSQIKGVADIKIQVDSGSKAELIKKLKPAVVFVGNDWTPETFSGEGLGVPVIYLERTKGISSTLIRQSAEKDYAKKAVATIQDLEKIMRGYDIFLNFGSLLGAAREGQMIEGDSDVDVCYLSKKNTKAEVIKECEELANGILSNYIKSWFLKSSAVKSYKGEEIIEPFGQFHIDTGRGVIIDLFTSWINEEGDFSMCQWGSVKDVQIEPFQKIPFERQRLKVPCDYVKLIQALFGADWETPKKEKIDKRITRLPYLYL